MAERQWSAWRNSWYPESVIAAISDFNSNLGVIVSFCCLWDTFRDNQSLYQLAKQAGMMSWDISGFVHDHDLLQDPLGLICLYHHQFCEWILLFLFSLPHCSKSYYTI